MQKIVMSCPTTRPWTSPLLRERVQVVLPLSLLFYRYFRSFLEPRKVSSLLAKVTGEGHIFSHTVFSSIQNMHPLSIKNTVSPTIKCFILQILGGQHIFCQTVLSARQNMYRSRGKSLISKDFSKIYPYKLLHYRNIVQYIQRYFKYSVPIMNWNGIRQSQCAL